MKTIYIEGAGGPAGIGLARCLKDHYTVTGYDSSEWARLMMEIPVLKQGDKNADLSIYLPDSLILRYSQMPVKDEFLPPYEQIAICQDKGKLADLIGNLAPKRYWGRDLQGAGGSGAEMISEYCPGKNYSQEFVYYKGRRLAHFQKLRVSYSVKSRTQGIDNRGSSAVSVCTNEEEVFDTAKAALEKLPGKLHGFYGIDLKCTGDGSPKVTEINAGRLLTASYGFFEHTGYNLPLAGVKAFFGEEDINPYDYPTGWGQIRQVGQLPQFFPPEVTKTW